MGSLRTLTVVAAVLAFGPGCAATKLWKKDEPAKYPEGLPTAPLSSLAVGNGGVIQTSATMPSESLSTPSQPSSMAKLLGKTDKKIVPDTITILWRNKIDYLPDPARNGEMGPGLVGQVFLFDPKMQSAPADGKLIIALYDESPRAPGQEPNMPEGWEFTKETLKGLRGYDERWGPGYVVFLPWPTYRPDVTRIRIAARFEPEQGHALYVPEARITLDNSGPGASGGGWTNASVSTGLEAPPSGGFNALGGPPPGAGNGSGPGFQPQSGSQIPTGTLQPAPPSFGAVPPAGAAYGGQPVNTAGLPPIAFTTPRPTGR